MLRPLILCTLGIFTATLTVDQLYISQLKLFYKLQLTKKKIQERNKFIRTILQRCSGYIENILKQKFNLSVSHV